MKNIKDKIPDVTNLPTNTTLNDKIIDHKNEIPIITNLPTIVSKTNRAKNKISSITNLATTTDLTITAVDNEIPKVSDLVKKADYNAEMKHIKNKYFTISDYNQFTNGIFDTKITANKVS